MYSVKDFGGVFSTEHLDNTFDSIVVVAMVVAIAEDAFAFEGAIFKFAQFFEIDGGAVDGFDDDVAETVEVADKSNTADDVAETAFGKDTAAGVEVVGFNFLGDVTKRDAVFGEFLGGEFNLILGGDAAVVAYIGDTGYLPKIRDDGPFMDVGKASEVVATVGAFDDVAEDFASGGSERVEFGCGAIGEVKADKTFGDTLSSPVVVDTVVKDKYDS